MKEFLLHFISSWFPGEAWVEEGGRRACKRWGLRACGVCLKEADDKLLF